MAIQSSSSDIEVIGGIPLFTGIATMSVVAINPTLGELSSIGVNMKSEPSYIDVPIGDNIYNKLIFWLHNDTHEFTTKLEILCKPEHKISKSGKFLYTNGKGQITYADQDPSEIYDWYSSDGVRKALVGEDTLLNFVRAWANTPSNGECSFDTIDKIMKGDVKELTQLMSILKDNKLRVLLGVKDGKYQQVYAKYFGRLKSKNDNGFIKSLNDEYSQFKAEYNSDLQLQNYSPEVVVPSETAPAETSADW